MAHPLRRNSSFGIIRTLRWRRARRGRGGSLRRCLRPLGHGVVVAVAGRAVLMGRILVHLVRTGLEVRLLLLLLRVVATGRGSCQGLVTGAGTSHMQNQITHRDQAAGPRTRAVRAARGT